jgi:hypothetical protein
MKRKPLIVIIFGSIAFLLLIFLLFPAVVEALVEKKIQNKFNSSIQDYILDIGKVDISIINPGIELKNITLYSKKEKEGIPLLKGDIETINLQGVRLLKAIFRKDIEISELTISNIHFAGIFALPQKAAKPKISPLNISIDRLMLDKLFIDVKIDSTAQAFLIKDGLINMRYLEVKKSDTLSPAMIKQIEFNAEELQTVTSDSLYTYTASGINYSGNSHTLLVSNFAIQPNYSDYEFTARNQFESDRFEADFSQVSFHGFSAEEYIRSGNLASTYIEIGELELEAFRDKREEFRHINRPIFQEMIYSYPGMLDIDSVSILSGKITYTEHDEEANEPGMIWFNELNARIYGISNDTVYKTREAYVEIKAEALLMGKGKANIYLKGRLFDVENSFELKGTLAEMDVKDLNPILEKNAYVYATSGNVETMNFSFTADNTRATGRMKLIYKGLDLAVKNKRTDDTTAVKERLISAIANMKVMDSNPMPGEVARIGIIDYERDPEKFLFNYCVKSIMSGILSSLQRNPKGSKK